MMLSALPFPEHLGDVPDLAGGQHERMDGAGGVSTPSEHH